MIAAVAESVLDEMVVPALVAAGCGPRPIDPAAMPGAPAAAQPPAEHIAQRVAAPAGLTAKHDEFRSNMTDGISSEMQCSGGDILKATHHILNRFLYPEHRHACERIDVDTRQQHAAAGSVPAR